MIREGGGQREGRGERRQERLLGGGRGGAPICELSNHQLKTTLMVPVGEAENKST